MNTLSVSKWLQKCDFHGWMSQFHSLLGLPYHHTLNKWSLSLLHFPYPYLTLSLPPPPPIQWVSPHIVSHLSVISLALLVKETSFPWLGACLPLSMPTHIFQRIDLEVPIHWFHWHHWWVPWTTWEESLVPLRMVVSHVLYFNSIIAPLRFV